MDNLLKDGKWNDKGHCRSFVRSQMLVWLGNYAKGYETTGGNKGQSIQLTVHFETP
jgi:hypothetical protein